MPLEFSPSVQLIIVPLLYPAFSPSFKLFRPRSSRPLCLRLDQQGPYPSLPGIIFRQRCPRSTQRKLYHASLTLSNQILQLVKGGRHKGTLRDPFGETWQVLQGKRYYYMSQDEDLTTDLGCIFDHITAGKSPFAFLDGQMGLTKGRIPHPQ